MLSASWTLKERGEWTFTSIEMSDFEKVFDPKFIDLGTCIQFHSYN
jgi:hypothetical protein